MTNRYLYLVKNTGILAISNFSSKILVFLLVPLYTRVLTTEEYGAYDIITTTIQLLIPVLTINISEAVVRYLMDKDIDRKDVITIGAKFSLLGCVLFTVIVGCNQVLGITSVFDDKVVLTIILFFSQILYQYTTSIAKGFEKVTYMAATGLISTLVVVFGNIAFLLYFKLGIDGFFWSNILGQLIPAVFLLIKLNVVKCLHCKVPADLNCSMKKYSKPLVLNTVGWWMNNALDRYAVTFICGTAVNGIFSLAYKIPNILGTVLQIFMQAWQISAIKEFSNNSKRFYGNMMNFINIAMGITCMVLIFTSKLLGRFLYSNDFFEAWQYVPYLLVSGVMNSTSSVLGPILSADRNSKALGLSTFYGAGINLVLNIPLVYLIGPQGATISTLISSFAIYAFRKRALKGKIENENIGIMMVSWIILILQATIMIYLESYIWQIPIIIIYLFLFRSDLKKICQIALNYIRRRY